MTAATSSQFKANAARQLADETLRGALNRSRGHFTGGRQKAKDNLPEFDDLRDQARDIKEQLDHARAELDIAKRQGNLAKAGELSYGVIPELEKKLADAENAEDSGLMVEEAVRPEQVLERSARGQPPADQDGSMRQQSLHLVQPVAGQHEGEPLVP